MSEVIVFFNEADEFVGYTDNLLTFQEQNPSLDFETLTVDMVEVLPKPNYNFLSQDLTWSVEHLGNKVCEFRWHITDVSEEERAKRVAHQNVVVSRQRSDAYRLEADPLHFKYQRGEATEAEWLAKIEEIKQRYPKIT